MNCDEATRRLAESPNGQADTELQQHLNSCHACREFAAFLPMARAEMPTGARIAAIQADLTRNWKPVNPLPGAGVQAVMLWAFYAAVAIAAAVAIGFAGVSAMPFWQLAVYIGAFAAVAALVAFVAVQRLNPGMLALIPGTRASWFATALLTALVPLLFPKFGVQSFSGGEACLKTGCEVAAGAAVVFGFAVRRTFASRPIGAGAAVGLLAGLCGVTALALHCPVLNTPHILVWHFAVLGISSAVGALLGFFAEHTAAKRTAGAPVP